MPERPLNDATRGASPHPLPRPLPQPQEIAIGRRSPARFAGLTSPAHVHEIRRLAEELRGRIDGRTIWNVNSTAAGGGVAELLRSLLAYARGLGVATRWMVIGGNAGFFRVTKRLHHALHGEAGDGSDLGPAEARTYDEVMAHNARRLVTLVRPRDIVILHDPQTAGLAPRLSAAGAVVIWRCHIGDDRRSAEADRGWRFLEPHLAHARAFVFSRAAFVPAMCDHGRSVIVPPSIDPFTAKNADMNGATARAILVRTGLVAGPAGEAGRPIRVGDGPSLRMARRAGVLRSGPPPGWGTPLVVQVSRWDRLKDPVGVMRGFARLAGDGAAAKAELILAGPAGRGAADDPEGAGVLADVVAHWRLLPENRRRRVHLANLPVDDVRENAAIVNALQRHAAVVVQKSLREGFGLTVTEAMWKGRPIVASAVGGIQDQVEDNVSGLLLRDPADPAAFAALLERALTDTELAGRLGRNARVSVARRFLGLRSLAQYADLIRGLDG